MNDLLDKRIRKVFVGYGFILGIIYLALSITSFYFITQFSHSPVLFVAAPIFFAILIPIVVVVYLCFSGRSKIGGYWTFKQATTGIFIMFIITYGIQLACKNFVFDRLIEPNSVQKTEDAAISAKIEILKQKKYTQKAIDADITELKKDIDAQKNVSVGNLIQGTTTSIIFIFIFALIFGSLFKKDPPVYAEQ
jgi:hypothetical protein